MMHPSKQAHSLGSYYLGLDEDFADLHGMCCLSPSWWGLIFRLNVDTKYAENMIDSIFCEHCRRMLSLLAEEPIWQ